METLSFLQFRRYTECPGKMVKLSGLHREGWPGIWSWCGREVEQHMGEHRWPHYPSALSLLSEWSSWSGDLIKPHLCLNPWGICSCLTLLSFSVPFTKSLTAWPAASSSIDFFTSLTHVPSLQQLDPEQIPACNAASMPMLPFLFGRPSYDPVLVISFSIILFEIFLFLMLNAQAGQAQVLDQCWVWSWKGNLEIQPHLG